MSVDELERIGWQRVGHVWVAPDGLAEPPAHELIHLPGPKIERHQLAPCGTQSAYRRHSRRGEDCTRCDSLRNDNLRRART